MAIRNDVQCPGPVRQQGVSTLAISLILLVILTMITLFAVRVGVGEQKVAFSEQQQAKAFRVAEGHLGAAKEFLKANSSLVLGDVWFNPTNFSQPLAGGAGWRRCDASPDLKAFCVRAVCNRDPADATRESICLAGGGSLPTEQDITKLYVFVDTAASTDALDGQLDNWPNSARLPLQTGLAEGIGRAGAILCLLDKDASGKVVCNVDPSRTNSKFAIRLVGAGAATSDGDRTLGSAVVSEFVTLVDVLGQPPDVPLMATSNIKGVGNFNIVPNPNAGGPNLPVSIWTPDVLGFNGAFSTCHLGDFLYSSAINTLKGGGPIDGRDYGKPSPAEWNGDPRIPVVCTGCECSKRKDTGTITYKDPSGTGSFEGTDILDADGNSVNAPQVGFPADLFGYVFGRDKATIKAFAESEGRVLADCSGLGPSSSGLYWITGTCAIKGGVGTPTAAVTLIAEKGLTVNGATGKTEGVFFGLMYLISGEIKLTGGLQVYGAIISESNDQVDATGGLDLIYSEAVLRAAGPPPRAAPIPGSWTDRVAY